MGLEEDDGGGVRGVPPPASSVRTRADHITWLRESAADLAQANNEARTVIRRNGMDAPKGAFSRAEAIFMRQRNVVIEAFMRGIPQAEIERIVGHGVQVILYGETLVGQVTTPAGQRAIVHPSVRATTRRGRTQTRGSTPATATDADRRELADER